MLREGLIMRRSLRYGTLIFREFRSTNEGIGKFNNEIMIELSKTKVPLRENQCHKKVEKKWKTYF